MNNNMRHSKKRQEVKEERKIKLSKKATSLIISFVMGTGVIGSTITLTSCSKIENNKTANEKDNRFDSKEYFDYDESEELEKQVSESYKNLDNETKKYVDDENKWILLSYWLNQNDYPTQFNADNFQSTIYNSYFYAMDEPWTEAMFAVVDKTPSNLKNFPKLSNLFPKNDNKYLSILTEREDLMQTILNDPASQEAYNAAEKLFSEDILLAYDKREDRISLKSLPAGYKMALQAMAENYGPVLREILGDNYIYNNNELTVNMVQPAEQVDTDHQKMDDFGSEEQIYFEDNTWYTTAFLSQLNLCSSSYGNEVNSDWNDDNDFSVQKELDDAAKANSEKRLNNTTSKLEMINNALDKATAIKEVALSYKDKNGQIVRVYSNINC